MKIAVKRINDAYHFQGKNEDGNLVNMDANPEIGGEHEGIRPMQMLLYGLAGCSGIDVVSMLKKGRQNITNLEIEVEAQREADKVPSLFTSIHVHFILEGDLEPDKVERALQLSFEKYCSVALTLEKSVPITYDYSINKGNER